MNLGITQNHKPHSMAGDCFMPISLVSCAPKPIDKLFFPKELVSEIGMCKHQIAFLRHKGCRFYGRKTSIRWIREFLNAYTSGAAPSEPPLQVR
jgi:hypothetical protein